MSQVNDPAALETPTELRLLLSSCPAASADRLARVLVQARVCACVSVLPQMVSRYHWDGVVQRDDESLLLCKTPADRVEAAAALLAAEHPYTVPEILVLPIAAAAAPYAAWAVAETRVAR
ncbi:MAG: divalent-cation tolerance protein CutA [Deltaproteobacteria bacterium]|nr:divalent-cation tolerance protein CutA [Deltaproteobacteria bacterium]